MSEDYASFEMLVRILYIWDDITSLDNRITTFRYSTVALPSDGQNVKEILIVRTPDSGTVG